MSVPIPPHPGPRPAEFRFPFAQAQAALRGIEDLIDDLDATIRTHQQAVVRVRVGFEGRTRREFDSAFEELMAELSSARGQLDGDASALEDAIREAERRRQASLDAIAAHGAALRAHHQAVVAARAAANAP
jgi:hypothetical protein